MFRNPVSTFTKTTILQVVPVSQFFSAQDSVHGFLTWIQNGIFHILQLLKFPSIKDVTWKIIFEIVCIILLKNLILETWKNLLVKRDREKKFYFSLCGFLEKVRNLENTFTKTTILRF